MWAQLQTAARPAPNHEAYAGKTGAELVAVRATVAANYLAKADALKAFYDEHPEAAQAKEAKRLEAMNLMWAAQAGDNTQEGRWKTLANEIRRDQGLPASERFAVAAQADFMHVNHNRNLTSAERWAALKQVARGLAAEFPTEPGGYESLLGLARSSRDPAEARALAEEVAGMPAPTAVKLQARQLADRFAMVGQKLGEVLAAAGFPDAIKAGKPLVIYSWSTWSEGSQVLAEQIRGKTGAAEVVGLCLDPDLGAAKTAAEKRALPGNQIFDSRGIEGALAQALRLSDAGWIYVVDSSGILTTVRGQDDLSALSNL